MGETNFFFPEKKLAQTNRHFGVLDKRAVCLGLEGQKTFAIREGFIIETRKELKITDKGLAFISETNNKLNRHGIERSIARIPDVYIEKLSADAVYLPEKI